MTKTAFVFPGQGSQTVGMLADVAARSALVEATFTEASTVLGYDLWQLVCAGPEEKLNQTEFTQPALLTAGIAMWRVAMAADVPVPAAVAGHSLGEYTALVAAGTLDFGEAVRLVRERGRFMQSAVPLGEGGMAAVLGLADDEVVRICAQASGAGGVVQAANFNSPGQVVIAGDNRALGVAIEALKAAGAKRAMPLSVSAPFHSQLMQPAADKMAEALAGVTFKPPVIAVLQNVEGNFESDPEKIRQNLVRQMCSAVMWTTTIVRLNKSGITRVVECGPGKVLAGLNKRIVKEMEVLSLGDSASMDATLPVLLQ